MPTLKLQIAPPQTAARYQSLARALTAMTADLLGKRAEVTAVLIEELPPSRWFTHAEAVQRPTALLEISITAQSNTTQQKAEFIAAAFAELETQIDEGQGLEPASYVIVREVAATDWGYGGRTQADRRAHS
jgi:4-oxalocrotonate tautomerase